MLVLLINTINLSSKDNSLQLPTNCDTLPYNSVLSYIKALQEIKKCISSSTLLLSHTSHTLCSTGNLSYLHPFSIFKRTVPNLNIGLLWYISVSKVFLNVLYVLNLLLPFRTSILRLYSHSIFVLPSRQSLAVTSILCLSKHSFSFVRKLCSLHHDSSS